MKTLILLAFTFTSAVAQVANAQDQDQAKQPAKSRTKAPPPPAPHVAPKVQGRGPAPVHAIPPKGNQWQQRTPYQAKVAPVQPNPYTKPRISQGPPAPYVRPKDVPAAPPVYTNPRASLYSDPPQKIVKQLPAKPPVVAVQPNPNPRNGGWDNDRSRDRHNTGGARWTNRPPNLIPWREACHRHRPHHHHRDWWTTHYTRFCLFGTGYYFWDAGYWYPAYGYDVAYNTYPYEAPIVAYADLEPAEVIANVQTELQRLGYYQYEVDGLMGQETQSALADFQRDNGLEITAAIDEPTLEALGLE